MTRPADGEWGQQLNGSWTGLVGMLIKKDVDMVAAPLTRQFDRDRVVDFTEAFYEETSRFVYKKPGPLEDKWWAYLAPLKWDVYLCLVAVFLAVCVIALVIDQIHPNTRTTGHFIGRLHVIWGFLSNLLRQENPRPPLYLSARVIGGSWLFFTIIMAAVYSGNLIAFLTVNKDKIPFKSVEDLLAQDQYKWGIPGGSVQLALIKTSNQSEDKRIMKGISKFVKTDPDVLSHSLEVHVNKVLAGHYAFLLGDYVTSYYFSNNCDVTTIAQHTYRRRYCFALPNNSPYTSKFSEGMIKMRANGFLDNLDAKYSTRRTCTTNKHAIKPTQMVDVQGAFYVVTIGIGLSLVCLIFEVLLFRITARVH